MYRRSVESSYIYLFLCVAAELKCDSDALLLLLSFVANHFCCHSQKRIDSF